MVFSSFSPQSRAFNLSAFRPGRKKGVMMTSRMETTLSRSGQNLWATGLALGLIAVIGGAVSIPFLYESSTMYYKIGGDKLLLRFAKMIGLVAAVLLLVQLPLAGRLKRLDRIFSLPVLYRFHRMNAWLIGLLVISHPLLVLAPEGRWVIPFERRYWPEWLGVVLLSAIAVQIIMSRWRGAFFKPYHVWHLTHCTIGAIIAALLVIHMLYVSETFEFAGFPRSLVFGAAGGWLLLWGGIRTGRLRVKKRQFDVIRIEAAGRNAYCIDLVPAIIPSFGYLPGQFAFISFDSGRISREYHPFTLSSSPSRPGAVQVIIRCCGDWTHRIGRIQKGDAAFLQGPFGCFSHRLMPTQGEVVMIAGGIGITPMLSMLRYMYDIGDSRRITLIWSNRTRAHVFGVQELSAMAEKLTTFRWVPIFTREMGDDGRIGRLDRTALEILLQACDRRAAVLVCGPPPMVAQLRKDLKVIGFAAKSIHFEVFGF